MAEYALTLPGSSPVKTFIAEEDGKVIIGSHQDIEPVLKANERDRNLHAGYIDPDMRHAARIPDVIVERLMKAGIWQDKDRLRAWLNSEAAKPFRIYKGRV